MIVQSHTVSGQPKRRDGIQEAGGKSSKAAVSQRGFRLDLLDLSDVLSVLLQHISGFLKQPKVDQVVGKQLTDEELCGNVIQLPASLVSFHSFHSLFGDAQKRRIDFLIGRVLNGLSEFFLQKKFQFFFHLSSPFPNLFLCCLFIVPHPPRP